MKSIERKEKRHSKVIINKNFIIKNMHSGVKEEEIIEVIEKAEKNLKESENDMICIFFDEINTTSLLSKMKEIFVNHSLNGKEIDQRIRFIGACNPFRRNKKEENEEGLKLEKIDGEEEQKEKEEPKAYENLVQNIATGLTSEEKKPEEIKEIIEEKKPEEIYYQRM